MLVFSAVILACPETVIVLYNTIPAGDVDSGTRQLSEHLVSLATAVLDFVADASGAIAALTEHCVRVAAFERDAMEEEEQKYAVLLFTKWLLPLPR